MSYPFGLRLVFLCVFGAGLASCAGAGGVGSAGMPSLALPRGSGIAPQSALSTNGTGFCAPVTAGAVPLFVQMQKNSTIGSSVTITLSCTPNVGDLLVAYVNDYGTTPPTLNTPTSWKALENSTYHVLSTRQGQAFSHIVAQGDPATYTFSATGTTDLDVILGDYAGTDQTNPIEKHGIFEHGLAGAHNTATLVPGLPNELPISFFVSNTNLSGASSTPKSGWTSDLSSGGPAWLIVAQHGPTNGPDTTTGINGTNTWSVTAQGDYDYLALLAPCVSPSCVVAATPIPTAPPSPVATPSPIASPTPPPTGGGDTAARIGLMQVFDFGISSTQAVTDGPHYDFVWGASKPRSWYTNQPSLVASQYFVFERDDTHTLAWYQANHPDWILYNCTSSGDPTQTPAYLQAGAYGNNPPLDIHNPAVIDFSVKTLAVAPAIASGETALAIDEVVFSNLMGGNAGSGSYGCGVWQGNTFVKRYASKSDSQWALDVVNWVKTAKSIITTDANIAPHHLKLIINHPAASTANPLEQSLLASADGALNETGFTNYGNYTRSSTQFGISLKYMIYEQAHGVTAMLIDKFIQSGALTPMQREWAIGTYLMGNNGNALMFATYGGLGTGGYGKEYYYPEYATNMGAPCEAVTGGPAIYERRFANGVVVVNAATTTQSASLPLAHVYIDIEGRSVTSPMPVGPTDAYVMTTTAGTGCL